jgi:hypothetical protein
MFYRGQRIKILSSSVSGHQHPAPGDSGYLSNVYLLIPYRVLLVNAFFTKYGNEPTGFRCERKRFFIDLGVNSMVRDSIINNPMEIINLITTDSWRRVDLTSVFRSYSGGQIIDYPQMFSTHGMFSTDHNFNQEIAYMQPVPGSKSSKKSKKGMSIPICTAKFDNEKGSLLSSPNEMKAWFNAIRPIIYYTLFMFNRPNHDFSKANKNKSVGHIVTPLMSDVMKCLKFENQPSNAEFNDNIKFCLIENFADLTENLKTDFIIAVRKLISISDLISSRHDTSMLGLTEGRKKLSTPAMLTHWVMSGFTDALMKYNTGIEIIIANQIVRTILVSSNADEVRIKLEKMQRLGLLPSFRDDIILQYINDTVETVKEVQNDHSLASLDRLLSVAFLQL